MIHMFTALFASTLIDLAAIAFVHCHAAASINGQLLLVWGARDRVAQSGDFAVFRRTRLQMAVQRVSGVGTRKYPGREQWVSDQRSKRDMV